MSACTKCGAGEDAGDSAYSCGTRKGVNGTVKVSGHCLRRQLAAVTAERNELSEMLGKSVAIVAAATAERDELLRMLNAVREWAAGNLDDGCSCSKEYRDRGLTGRRDPACEWHNLHIEALDAILAPGGGEKGAAE